MQFDRNDVRARGTLLVVTNATEVAAAREQLSATEGIRIRVVSWNDEKDDDDLRAALSELVAPSSPMKA
jgi:hypothetical protein